MKYTLRSVSSHLLGGGTTPVFFSTTFFLGDGVEPPGVPGGVTAGEYVFEVVALAGIVFAHVFCALRKASRSLVSFEDMTGVTIASVWPPRHFPNIGITPKHLQTIQVSSQSIDLNEIAHK
jgi:hypothetical protein